MTAISTTPPASTTWTTDIGAIASAATWKPQALVATTMPIANHFERVQRLRRAQRVTDVDRRGLAGAAVLEEEAEVRDERAEEREQDAELKGHG